jgi:4-amino-4-deoxy-L-arabinose transferase-like glycosyltransferase
MSTPALASRHPIALAVPSLAPALVASAVAWALLFTAVPPAQQDFPLNDDWAFARGFFRLSRGQGIDYCGWASMPQLGQWLWASPFVWLFGESHAALRLSTILISWLGLAAFHDLLRQQDVSPGRAGLATATLALNPLFFLLQGTFMTDVPALALGLVALALYSRALRGQQIGWLATACVLGILAAVTRQNTLAVVGAAGVLLWRRPELRRRIGWWIAVLAPAAVGAAVYLWFGARTDVRQPTPALPAPAVLLALPFVALHLAGLSALPLFLACWRGGSWKGPAAACLLFLLVAGYWWRYGNYLPYGGLFPYAENMLTPWGAFAGSKFTGLLVVGERPLLLDTGARLVLTGLGCLAGAALVVQVARRWRPGAGAAPLPLFTFFSIPFILIAPDFYDRYLLFVLPGALALAAADRSGVPEAESGRAWLAPLATLTALGLISIGLMHDWLAWNAARWQLGRRAVARQIEPRDIEGGVEWDAWYAPPDAEPPPNQARRWPVLPFTREWFPAITGHFALSFSPVRGSMQLDSEAYELWLMPGRRQFLLIEAPPLPPTSDPGRETRASPRR